MDVTGWYVHTLNGMDRIDATTSHEKIKKMLTNTRPLEIVFENPILKSAKKDLAYVTPRMMRMGLDSLKPRPIKTKQDKNLDLKPNNDPLPMTGPFVLGSDPLPMLHLQNAKTPPLKLGPVKFNSGRAATPLIQVCQPREQKRLPVELRLSSYGVDILSSLSLGAEQTRGCSPILSIPFIPSITIYNTLTS